MTESNEAAEQSASSAEKLELYELGFHFVPTLSEAELAEQAAAVRKMLDAAGAIVKLSDGPKLQVLTYSFERRVAGKKESFNTSFFGSFVFEIAREAVESLNKSLKENQSVLRFLITELPKEALLPKERPLPASGYSHDPKKGAEKPAGDVKPISEAELDKTIEELVVE